MWLLNTRTYELQNFVSGRIPPYAILSHRWGRSEVSFADMQDLSVAQEKRGWEKVEKACWCALNTFNCSWIWDDTCCIDKSSSAELSEAINSMYAWYEAASICIAYLHDVEDWDEDFPEGALASFRESRWFTRGWTIQELIAPLKLVFYSTSWIELGTRMDWATVLEDITGIDANVLNRHGTDPEEPLSRKSVAERMSWASRRETTREEDMAYCLMGVFNVHMPPIYGEGGEGAFRRLQLEIMQRTNDRSILA
ncbi:HET-domain-containing protein, partial [Trametes versicolor FP-101664 SS1]|uniref:HET-domain-containing protein n=1 Tax=Trametes versicolor (strain FP-101664) TaxID=717944 RepID=UPI000462194C